MPNKQRAFYAVYFIGMAFLGIVLLEIGSFAFLKFKDQGDSPVAGSRHLYHPYRTHQLNPEYQRPVDTAGVKLHSPDGFRSDRAFTKDKPEGVFRIIMMGGSTMYGTGAEPPYPRAPSLQNNETISYFLEKKLNEGLEKDSAGIKVEIINAAVTAYATFHHVVYINEVLYEYSPDMIVFLDGHNDYYIDEVYNRWQTYDLGTGRLTEHFNQRDFWFTSLAGVRYLSKFSRFARVVERYLERDWPATPKPRFLQTELPRTVPTEFPDNVETVMEEGILKSYVQIQALAKLFDFEMLVFLQPQIVLEDSSKLSEPDKHLQKLTQQYDTNTRRGDLRPYFPRFFKEYNLPFADIAEIASDNTAGQQLYIDYCHLTPAGSTVVAERMYPRVHEMLQNRIGSGS